MEGATSTGIYHNDTRSINHEYHKFYHHHSASHSGGIAMKDTLFDIAIAAAFWAVLFACAWAFNQVMYEDYKDYPNPSEVSR